MKILVCTDGSEQSQKAISKALEIAGGRNTDVVTLFSVSEVRYDFPQAAHDRVPLTPEDIERFKELGELDRAELKTKLEDAAKIFEKNNIEVNTVVETGHPAEAIARYAAKGNYDMIVIGSRGLGGLKKLLLGSVSSAVLQEATCSVLVVK